MDSKYKSSRGVVYLGHVPHGFYEQEMKSFFSQFGKVTNINIPRSTVSTYVRKMFWICSLFNKSN